MSSIRIREAVEQAAPGYPRGRVRRPFPHCVLGVLTIGLLAAGPARGQSPVGWRQVATTGPGVRIGAGMAFDSVRGKAVLFGGYDGNQNLCDTWEWDGIEWRQVATTGPGPRYRVTMAFDSARGRTVLHGGMGGGGDTWEWDGSQWTQVSTAGPSARYDAVMAYDSCLLYTSRCV